MAKTATKKPAAKKTTAKKAKTTKKPAKAAAKKTTKKPAAKKATAEKVAEDQDKVVEMERREGERRDETSPVAVKTERRKVARRRQIDPTTCERDYSDHEIEFMQAMDAYKRASGRMFPTCSEILEVVRSLGYCRPGDEPVAVFTGENSTEEELDDELTDTDAVDDSDVDLE